MKNYNWQVTNLYTLDTTTETDYVVNAVYDVIGTETSEGVEYTMDTVWSRRRWSSKLPSVCRRYDR